MDKDNDIWHIYTKNILQLLINDTYQTLSFVLGDCPCRIMFHNHCHVKASGAAVI